MTKEEIKALRVKLGLTQQEFANRLGLKVDTIRSWEYGYRKPKGPGERLLQLLQEEKGN